ncbi:hypothetical protein D9615_008932 [Tricholomella constricta]|uniref:Fungal-type protein kinase domain-containing protein n=1 Tax=Tricholomella constricta TaxID=117010 RepID=A0A8H5H113_9AGAR|nr:hypothetical protein D9615_008932 [Tricholomella constricta]
MPVKTSSVRGTRSAPPKRNGGNDSSRIHHRLVANFIGKSLNTCTSSKDLIRVAFDAFKAHQQAYKTCGIVHGDISVRNILIKNDDSGPGGVLHDWDLANYEVGADRHYERTGTREFTSCLILTNHPGHSHDAHTIQDSMESFFYIILYTALRYFPYIGSENAASMIKDIIFEYERVNWSTGYHRKLFLQTRSFNVHGIQFISEPLHCWFAWVHKDLSEWIQCVAPPPGSQIAKIYPGASDSLDLTLTKNTTTISRDRCALYTHAGMVKIFERVLSLDSWPLEDEKPVDSFIACRSAVKHTMEDDYVDQGGLLDPALTKTKRRRTAKSRSISGIQKSLPDL